uniref:Phage P22-like portal protein n=1 Tax=Desulfovibrio sp. U5L TaxID=596152 RepID=I2Q033_9BACT
MGIMPAPENYRSTPEKVIHFDAIEAEEEPTFEGHPLDSPEALKRRGKVIDWWCQARDAQSLNRIEQALDHDYYDGLQWSDEDRRVLQQRGQAALVFNKVMPTINWICGTEKKTRIDYRVVPRGPEDTEPAEAKTKLLKYLSDVNRTGFHRSKAFQDAAISGVGWIEHCVVADPDDEPLRVRYEDWRNVWYDHLAVELDLSDARYLFRSKWVDEDLACAMFPDRAEKVHEAAIYLANNAWTDDDEFYFQQTNAILQDGRPASSHMSSVGEYANVQNRRTRVKLVECWYREPAQCQCIRGKGLGPENGSLFDESNPLHQFYVENGQATVIDALKLQVRCAIFTGNSLLWEGPSPYRHNRFPFVPVWCYRRKRDNAPYGVVRGLRDVQDDLNKRRSKALWLLSNNQMIYEQGALSDPDAARDELSAPDGMVETAPGAIDKVIVRDQPQLAEWQVRLMEQNAQYLQDAAGVTDENLGQDTNAKSGKAIQARQQQGHVVTAGIFDNLRLSVQLSGEIQLSLVEQFYDTPKVLRILGSDPKAMEFVQLNARRADGMLMNPITASAADFVVDEEDFNQSTRQAMFDSLMQAVQTMSPELGAQLLPTALSLSDLPQREEIIAKVNKALGLGEDGQPAQPQGPDPAAQQAAESQAMLDAAKAEDLKASAELKRQQAVTEQTEQAVRAHGMQFDQNAQDMERVKLVADVANKHEGNRIAAAKTAGEPRPGHQVPGLKSDNPNPGSSNPV